VNSRNDAGEKVHDCRSYVSLAQRNVFRRRDARQQSTLFALDDPRLTHSPNSNRLYSEDAIALALFLHARRLISGQSKGAVYRDQRHRKAGHHVSGAWSAVRDSWLGHRLAAPRLPEVRRDSRYGDRSLSPRKTSRQTTIETSPHVRQEGHSLQAPRLATAVL
jgi:hypothetical protein